MKSWHKGVLLISVTIVLLVSLATFRNWTPDWVQAWGSIGAILVGFAYIGVQRHLDRLGKQVLSQEQDRLFAEALAILIVQFTHQIRTLEAIDPAKSGASVELVFEAQLLEALIRQLERVSYERMPDRLLAIEMVLLMGEGYRALEHAKADSVHFTGGVRPAIPPARTLAGPRATAFMNAISRRLEKLGLPPEFGS